MKYRVWCAVVGFAVLTTAVPAAGQSDPHQGLTLLHAVKTALDRHPQLLAQQQEVEISRARRQQAASAFDTTWTAGVSHTSVGLPLTRLEQNEARLAGFTFSDNRTSTTGYGGGLSRRLRNGITLEPKATIARTVDRLAARDGLEQSSISLDVRVPLLRGRGRDVVTAEERSADLQVKAALLDVNQAMAERILDVVTAYWEAAAAQRLLALSAEAEDRGRRLVEETRRLVEAGRVPAADMNHLLANLASRSAEHLAAEQALLEARETVSLAMGLLPDEAASLPDLVDDLPDPQPGISPHVDVDALTRQALGQRADYLAILERVRVAEVAARAARDSNKPQLDLGLSGGYSALQEGLEAHRLFTNLFYQPSGPNLSLGFQYSFAPARNLDQGRIAEAQAALRAAMLRRDDLARFIAARMVTAAAGVQRAAAALDKAREAVGYHRQALDGEREKHTLGRSSLIDLLTVEDRLTTVLQTESRARLRHGLSIAHLRFNAGALIRSDQPHPTVTREDLTTVPLPGLPGQPGIDKETTR